MLNPVVESLYIARLYASCLVLMVCAVASGLVLIVLVVASGLCSREDTGECRGEWTGVSDRKSVV